MKAIKNLYVKKLLNEKRILINYLYDALGFRCGAVVAVKQPDGEVRFGISRVHPYDYKRESRSFLSLPPVQDRLLAMRREADRLIKEGEELAGALLFAADELESFLQFTLDKLFAGDYYYEVPMFDRDKALVLAIKAAKSDVVETQYQFLSDANKYVVDKIKRRAAAYFGDNA